LKFGMQIKIRVNSFLRGNLLVGAEGLRACHKGAGGAGTSTFGRSIASAGVTFIHELLSSPIVAALEVTNGLGFDAGRSLARGQIGTNTLACVALIGISLSNRNHDAVVLAYRGRGFDDDG